MTIKIAQANTGSRKSRRHQKNRLLILEAAKGVFSRRGFEKTTMADIAQAAEMATGTLYLYFRGKEELFYALMEKGMNRLIQDLRAVVTEEKGWEKRLRLFIQKPFEFFEENRDFYKIYLRELPFCNAGERRQSMQRCFQGHLEYVDMLEECLKKGLGFRSSAKYPVREAALMIRGAVDFMILESMLEESSRPLTEKVDFMLEVFKQGLIKAVKKNKITE